MLTVIFAWAEDQTSGNAVYFALITGLTVGYGDITPVTPIGKAASAAIAVVGVITAGIYVGIATRAVSMSLRGHRLTRDSGPDNTISNRAIWAPRTRLARPDPGATGTPSDHASVHLGAVESYAPGELPPRQEPRRPGNALNQVQDTETFRGGNSGLPRRRPAWPLRLPSARRLYVDAARRGAYSWLMSTSNSVASPPAGDREIVQEPAALIDRAADWLMEQALGQTALEDLFRGCCERLLGAGIPLSRAEITFRVLHPLYEAMGMTWLRGSAVESASYVHREGEQPPEPFASSPLWHMARTQLPFLRRRLTGDAAIVDFPALVDCP